MVRIDQKWSISVKIGDFEKIDGFEVVHDVNWIIDKSWQVVYRIDQNCQNLSILVLLDQISSKSSILTNLSDLVTTWMSTESSTKVDRYVSKLTILLKSVKFSWFLAKTAKIVNFDDLRVSRSLMNPNRNCQNWRFRQFWQLWHKMINLYTGLYTNPVSSIPPNPSKPEITDFDCFSKLIHTRESPLLLPTYAKSWKCHFWTQKLKISDQEF